MGKSGTKLFTAFKKHQYLSNQMTGTECDPHSAHNHDHEHGHDHNGHGHEHGHGHSHGRE